MISLPRGDDAVLGEDGMEVVRSQAQVALQARAWSAVGVILGWLEAHEGQAAYASIQNNSGLTQGLADRSEAA
jgi:hypothetical protein